LLACGAWAATAVGAPSALALPGLDLSAGLHGAYDLAGNGFGADLDAYVGTPFFKVSGHALTMGAKSVYDASLRFEPLPIVSVRPGLGYQMTSGLGATQLIYPSVLVAVGIPLVPISFEAEAGAGLDLMGGLSGTFSQPLVHYTANANLFPIPLLPLAISARYRAYQSGTSAPAISAVEAGLRVAL
jgi:hypothetical protein